MDPQLILFRRQYLQLFEPEFIAWPPRALLRDAALQAWIYTNCFDSEKNSTLPTARYQLRILKPLLARIEKAIEDPEEDEISDDLMNHLSTLMASDLPGEATAVQQKSYVTFACLPPGTPDEHDWRNEPTITLLERRHLLSGSLTTGFRTWEAALHLGSYLLTPAGQEIIRGKCLIELGAGTGFLSILAAKHLGSKHVTTTDGDEGVVETLKQNLFLNGLDDGRKVLPSVLRWGRGLRGTWAERDCESYPYDVVLGADITYEKVAISALVSTMRFLFDLRPKLHVLISGAIRNPETFETFRHLCLQNKFHLTEVDYQPTPIMQQTSLFYATAVPLNLLSIRKP